MRVGRGVLVGDCGVAVAAGGKVGGGVEVLAGLGVAVGGVVGLAGANVGGGPLRSSPGAALATGMPTLEVMATSASTPMRAKAHALTVRRIPRLWNMAETAVGAHNVGNVPRSAYHERRIS